LPLEPPVAIAAVWIGTTRRCVVTFDMPLQLPMGGFDLTNWRLTYSGGSKSPTSASISAPGNVLTLQFDASPGVTQIAYEPPPFDVVAVEPNGLPAAAFVMPL
jgi:hypothetical protein